MFQQKGLGLLLFRSWRRRNVASWSWRRSNFAAWSKTSAARSNSSFTAARRSGNASWLSANWGFATAANFSTTATVTVLGKQATAAAIAAVAAITMMTTAAAISSATATTVATAVATGVTAVATAATMTEQAGSCRLFTAHQGDTDDREENRDATENKTIHRTSKKNLLVP
jgi:hypothetical protein